MATEIAKSGQIKPLQQVLGHTDIRTMMNFYVHPDMDQLRSLIQGLGGYLTKPVQGFNVR